MQTSKLTLKRAPEARAQFGIGRTTFYDWIERGVMTRPISLGARAVGWPSYELDDILAARIAGKSEEEIRALVTEMMAARAST